ncbi:T6SS phospholipase effector Tle1-like catalytic domain-containing protein [Pseudomonas brassicacearum]|uniref:phospholipase effector Tle1 domain-containing protein n=1 Tax=Pseudomonas brassicacearum TaxID=930166 RepID=UPI00068C4DA3|nr:DUF2235 domain-containing protein [Pseudomonas brassicacearum]
MRTGLIMLATLMAGCSTHSQHLSIVSSQPVTAIAAQSQNMALAPLDRAITIKTQRCADQVEELIGSEPDDSYANVRARWRQLDCYYSNHPSRALVVLLDGTGNDKHDETNIWRMYNFALEKAVEGKPVIPFYDKGVGTNSQIVTGNAFGSGMGMNIRQAYRFLVEAYRPGDKIYLFGFSRGAFTARTLNGLLEFSGLAKLETVKPNALDDAPFLWFLGNLHSKVSGLYDTYRYSNSGRATFDGELRTRLDEYKRKEGIETYKIKVEAIGVFDTVPSLGFFLDDDPDNHRLELYAGRGYHAMSLDEQRDDFRLQRFGVPQFESQILEEVWFAGGHSDIGGGYGKDTNAMDCINPSSSPTESKPVGLEGTPLRWMLDRFKTDNLFVSKSLPKECMSGILHDEYFGTFGRIYQSHGLLRRRPVAFDSVHESVLTRMGYAQLPKPNQYRENGGIYHPQNLGHDPLQTFCILKTGQSPNDCKATHLQDSVVDR